MPIYQFRCRECGSSKETVNQPSPFPCSCGSLYKRVYSFTPMKPMEGHFNHSLGKYVSNEREYRDGLKAASEAASLSTGIDHNFVPVDYHDKKAFGVTDEGLHEQTKAWADKGLKVGQGDPND